MGKMRGREKKQAEDESRRRATPIKNDSRRRTRRGTGRKKSLRWKREKTERILNREMEEWSTIEAGRQEDTGGMRRGEKEEPKYPCTLIASI